MKSRESDVQQLRFLVEEKQRQVVQIEQMMNDFKTMAKELDIQISSEQERTGIADMGHFAYSTFAKAANQRRENLMSSVEDLEAQCTIAQTALDEASGNLQQAETASGRDKFSSNRSFEWDDQLGAGLLQQQAV